MLTPPQGEQAIIELYGDPITDSITWWGEHMLVLHLHPDWKAVPQLRYSQGFWINKALLQNAREVFEAIRLGGLIPAIKSFNGCQNTRMIRGGHKLSFHAFGAAVDFNANEIPLSSDCSKIDQLIPGYEKVVQIFEDKGWTWGGRFKTRPDGMHFQYGNY